MNKARFWKIFAVIILIMVLSGLIILFNKKTCNVVIYQPLQGVAYNYSINQLGIMTITYGIYAYGVNEKKSIVEHNVVRFSKTKGKAYRYLNSNTQKNINNLLENLEVVDSTLRFGQIMDAPVVQISYKGNIYFSVLGAPQKVLLEHNVTEGPKVRKEVMEIVYLFDEISPYKYDDTIK